MRNGIGPKCEGFILCRFLMLPREPQTPGPSHVLLDGFFKKAVSMVKCAF